MKYFIIFWFSLFSNTIFSIENSCVLSNGYCAHDSFIIKLKNRQLKQLKPNKIYLSTTNKLNLPKSLVLSINSTSMDMGTYYFHLHKTKQNFYEGDIFLPLCLQNTSEWSGKIFISKSAKRELVNVKFIMEES
ncbi:hypothetical protein CF386_12160 [Paraphotobacterium marinum]|uniref:Uncharacterized protein n=1 Tax=Paraphotobacterium marinum TaxID=1755811 RepID=A0A220VHI7_9GAMM|nr:hypothetical protein [Paraphotobacterium marinum]ASK79789.1 hypothetical protein CF386_12160 [Paraphotobacterium marinum]